MKHSRLVHFLSNLNIKPPIDGCVETVLGRGILLKAYSIHEWQ